VKPVIRIAADLLHQALETLRAERPVFYSESDFQHALGG
jgi:hypothetical protein